MEGFLKEKLKERQRNGLIRSLSNESEFVDFLSNDYLGLAKSEELHDRILSKSKQIGFMANGGTGSRLLSGNHQLYSHLESYLSKVFNSEATLVFNSGYAANQALVSSVTGKGDTILYDQLSHVCLKEGAWLSKAESFSFRHNDLEDLESKLQRSKGRVFVITESVFSMDGDEAPMVDIIRICKKQKALLIVDEAHSTGVFGENGSGWLCDKGLDQEVFARVYTFGKGMGVHGACVAGSQTLIDYLINFGRQLIYTTSLPPHSVLAIGEAFKYLSDYMHLQDMLKFKIELFQSITKSESDTAIQPILIPGSIEARALAVRLQAEQYDVRAILAPTVKEGTERLRICLHAFNSDEEIKQLANSINKFNK